MSTHTPGPWTAIPRADLAENGNVIVESSNEAICHVFDDENAPLIAKAPIAPKLAEALRELLFVSGQSMIVPNAYCEGCDASSDGRKIVHKQGCIFVRAPAALAEWDAQS